MSSSAGAANGHVYSSRGMGLFIKQLPWLLEVSERLPPQSILLPWNIVAVEGVDDVFECAATRKLEG